MLVVTIDPDVRLVIKNNDTGEVITIHPTVRHETQVRCAIDAPTQYRVSREKIVPQHPSAS